ncbi:MAG: M48 family metalloprotease [Candidatus Jidaibacter sp.]|jgi:Zn-dependent protease with chaperone function|nr:M48 family metalloprotease [Candidatus Jidaibacter sp.]
MVFLYIIAVLIFGCYCYARYKHFAIIKTIGTLANKAEFIPVLAAGHKLKSFTIEKTELIYASHTISIDFFSYCIALLLGFLGLNNSTVYSLYTNYAKILCYGKLRSQASGAHYIVNTRECIKKVSGRVMSVFVYGNSVYRYEGTLPIYTLNVQKIGETKSVSKAPVLRMLSHGFMAFVMVFTLLKAFSMYLSFHLVENFSIQDEKVLWSYMNESAVGERPDIDDVLKAEAELQSIIDEMPKELVSSKYNFKVHVSMDESVNASLYPAGNIVLTKGFVERLKYRNQAVFALAHMVKHYNNGDHIKALRDKIINLKIITKLFGENNFIGKLLVWRSDFDKEYPAKQEIEADKFALDVLNYEFASASGADVFEEDFYNITNAYIKLFSTHPFSPDRSDAAKNYITEQQMGMGREIPLKYVIENTSAPNKITPGELTVNDQFMDLFGKYRAEMGLKYQEYQNFLVPFNNILQISNKLTLAELNRKKQLLDKASFEIVKYKEDFKNIIKHHDLKITDLINFQQDAEQKRILTSLWQKEKNAVLQLVNFYIDRDRKILENQSILVQFLTSRFGSYKVTDQGIQFQTNKEKSDYRTLQGRIEELLKKAPPTERITN